MNRRQWLSLGTGLSLHAWQEAPPYPGVPYRNYAHCLPAYLRELAVAAYRRRNEELAKLTTPDAFQIREANDQKQRDECKRDQYVQDRDLFKIDQRANYDADQNQP